MCTWKIQIKEDNVIWHMGTSSICNFIIRGYVYTAGYLNVLWKILRRIIIDKARWAGKWYTKRYSRKSSRMITQAVISVLSIPYTTVYPIVGENRTCGIVKHNTYIFWELKLFTTHLFCIWICTFNRWYSINPKNRCLTFYLRETKYYWCFWLIWNNF